MSFIGMQSFRGEMMFLSRGVVFRRLTGPERHWLLLFPILQGVSRPWVTQVGSHKHQCTDHMAPFFSRPHSREACRIHRPRPKDRSCKPYVIQHGLCSKSRGSQLFVVRMSRTDRRVRLIKVGFNRRTPDLKSNPDGSFTCKLHARCPTYKAGNTRV